MFAVLALFYKDLKIPVWSISGKVCETSLLALFQLSKLISFFNFCLIHYSFYFEMFGNRLKKSIAFLSSSSLLTTRLHRRARNFMVLSAFMILSV